jgi:hypothetical protein
MRRAVLLLVPLFLFACDRQPVAPDSPAFNGASALNEIQYRNPERITWLDTDRDAGEPWDVLLLGYEPADNPACNGGVFGGGIAVREHIVVTRAGEGFNLNDPTTWNQGEGFHDLVTIIGTAPLYMYSRASFPLGGTDEQWCEFYKNGWVASGQWTATIYRDNDVTWLDYTPGMNVYGRNEHGVLRGTDGTKYKYLWKNLFQWNPENGVDRVIYDIDHVERIGN